MAQSDNQAMGEPVTIFRVSSDRIELDAQALESILLKTEAANLPIALVAIAGKLRTGKSFLMNIIRDCLASENNTDYLSSPDHCIEGFSWQAGPDGHTDGIVMWSKPFILQRSDGQQVAVFLMDTQGLFDTRTNIADSVTFFTLSTLLSSLQIYNTSRDIEMDQLERLQMFINFTKETDSAQLQNLLFLVRDWRHKKKHKYGFDGGREYLASIWNKAGENTSLVNIHEDIMNVYQKIECFLMPYPGQLVDNDEDFTGRVEDIDEVFLDMVRELTDILHADHIPIKTIEGKHMTGTILFDVVSAYAEHFQSGTMPEGKTIYETHLDAWRRSVLEEARVQFEADMKNLLRQLPLAKQAVEDICNLNKTRALQHYDDACKVKGTDDLKGREKFEESMDACREQLLLYNGDALFKKRAYIASVGLAAGASAIAAFLRLK